MKKVVALFVSVFLLGTAGALAQRHRTKRIQFERGRTTAVVKGQVDAKTIDNYDIRARAGQRMIVHLTSPGKNVRFGIALPGFDAGELEGASQVTDWEGELPDTGDYNIAVFVKKGAGTYTLEVTIR